jgi:hypothetical protein
MRRSAEGVSRSRLDGFAHAAGTMTTATSRRAVSRGDVSEGRRSLHRRRRALTQLQRAARDRDLHLHRRLRSIVAAALRARDLAHDIERLARTENGVLAIQI